MFWFLWLRFTRRYEKALRNAIKRHPAGKQAGR